MYASIRYRTILTVKIVETLEMEDKIKDNLRGQDLFKRHELPD